MEDARAISQSIQRAKWQERKSQWIFPSGARLWLTYLERDQDVLRYQGQAFSYVGFDELTQHPTPFAYNYMRSRLRTTDPSLPIFIRATTNPGVQAINGFKSYLLNLPQLIRSLQRLI